MVPPARTGSPDPSIRDDGVSVHSSGSALWSRRHCREHLLGLRSVTGRLHRRTTTVSTAENHAPRQGVRDLPRIRGLDATGEGVLTVP